MCFFLALIIYFSLSCSEWAQVRFFAFLLYVFLSRSHYLFLALCVCFFLACSFALLLYVFLSCSNYLFLALCVWAQVRFFAFLLYVFLSRSNYLFLALCVCFFLACSFAFLLYVFLSRSNYLFLALCVSFSLLLFISRSLARNGRRFAFSLSCSMCFFLALIIYLIACVLILYACVLMLDRMYPYAIFHVSL